MKANNNDDSEDSFEDRLIEVIRERERKRWDAEYGSWCNDYASVPENYTKTLKEGLVAHIELQPRRWIQHGLDLIGSRKAAGTIQLYGGQEGPDYKSYLPYPVFQMGAEVFLKGMWLYQYVECRKCTDNAYFAPEMRTQFLKRIKGISKAHDLLEIIGQVQTIDVYLRDAQLSQFLKTLSGVAKEFYLPVTDGDWRWADERYPKRFYNDMAKVGYADALKKYPPQKQLARLFSEAAERLEIVWNGEE